MENYSRKAMLIPFDDYLTILESRNNSDVGIVPDNFKAAKPNSVVGEAYPDLYSQASYINRDISELKSKMAESVKELFQEIGEDAIEFAIDSIGDYLSSFFRDSDDENTFSGETLRLVMSEAYCRGITAKTLLKLYVQNERLRKLNSELELTQKNILL